MAKETRKQQIIDAAIAVFAKQGYYKTTTADIAQAVGITQPYVFHFFKSKEELFVAVLQQSAERIAGVFRAVEAPGEQLIDQMGAAFYVLLERHRDETLLSMQAFTTAEPLIQQEVKEIFAHIHQVVREKFERAQIPKPGFQASCFIGLGMTAVMSEVLELLELSPYCEEG